MLHIVADDLYIETSGSAVTQYTEPLALDGKNTVQIEAWLVSARGMSGPGMSIALEASSDLENWKTFYYPYQISFYSSSSPWATAPSGTIGSVEPIPFEYVRLAITLNETSAAVVVRAGMRPRNLI